LRRCCARFTRPLRAPPTIELVLAPRHLSLRASSWILVTALALVARAEPDGWGIIRQEDGITSWEKKRADAPLSAFRARATLRADVWRILAVLEDVDRACEWTAHCEEMRRVRQLGERDMLVYAQMGAPWPVHDRDVITHVSVSYGEPGELTVGIRNVSDASIPERNEVVRLPRMIAHYRFREVGPGQTSVEYELEIDPGGTLPDWLKSLISKNFAHDTLDRLRDRVQWAERGGVYEERAAAMAVSAQRGGYRALTATATTMF
jgi:hypothetical protein